MRTITAAAVQAVSLTLFSGTGVLTHLSAMQVSAMYFTTAAPGGPGPAFGSSHAFNLNNAFGPNLNSSITVTTTLSQENNQESQESGFNGSGFVPHISTQALSELEQAMQARRDAQRVQNEIMGWGGFRKFAATQPGQGQTGFPGQEQEQTGFMPFLGQQPFLGQGHLGQGQLGQQGQQVASQQEQQQLTYSASNQDQPPFYQDQEFQRRHRERLEREKQKLTDEERLKQAHDLHQLSLNLQSWKHAQKHSAQEKSLASAQQMTEKSLASAQQMTEKSLSSTDHFDGGTYNNFGRQIGEDSLPPASSTDDLSTVLSTVQKIRHQRKIFSDLHNLIWSRAMAAVPELAFDPRYQVGGSSEIEMHLKRVNIFDPVRPILLHPAGSTGSTHRIASNGVIMSNGGNHHGHVGQGQHSYSSNRGMQNLMDDLHRVVLSNEESQTGSPDGLGIMTQLRKVLQVKAERLVQQQQLQQQNSFNSLNQNNVITAQEMNSFKQEWEQFVTAKASIATEKAFAAKLETRSHYVAGKVVEFIGSESWLLFQHILSADLSVTNPNLNLQFCAELRINGLGEEVILNQNGSSTVVPGTVLPEISTNLAPGTDLTDGQGSSGPSIAPALALLEICAGDEYGTIVKQVRNHFCGIV